MDNTITVQVVEQDNTINVIEQSQIIVNTELAGIQGVAGLPGPSGQKGQDGTGTNFYPLDANPSGYLTNQTASGNFYPLNNPSGFITGVTGNLNVNTGILTGAFYPLNSNPAGYLTSVPTGNLTGAFYPLTANPANYITAAQTGNFYTKDNPSGFITGLNTGNFITTSQTGAFYSSSNPSGYITNSGFITSSQVGGVQKLNITGFGLSGVINLTGVSGISIITGDASNIIIGINSGLFYSVGNPAGYISNLNGTGVLTGAFYPLSSNPAGYVTGLVTRPSDTGVFATTGQLNATGTYLLGLINASSAGVSSLNSASGVLTLNGAGNVSVITNGQTITVSGNTGAYANFITTGQTGAFYSSSNPNGYITNSGFTLNSQTGNFASIAVTGSSNLTYVNLTGISGISVSLNPTGVLINGNGLQNQITTITNWTGTTPTIFIQPSQTGAFYSSSNPAGYITNSGFITNAQTGAFYPLNNPSGFIVLSQVGGVQQLSVTGFNLSGIITITGLSGISVTTGNASIIQISINTGAFYSSSNPSNFITAAQTGNFVDVGHTGNFVTTSQTGAFYSSSNPSNYVSSAQLGGYGVQSFNITGYNISGAITLTGLSGISVTTGNSSTIQISINTGLFYPNANNPSGFILPSQTGFFITGVNLSKSITIPSPTTTDNFTMFYTPQALNIQQIESVLVGSATPTVSGTILFDAGRSNAGTEIIAGGFVTNSTFAGNSFTSLTNQTVSGGSFVWIKLTGINGTVTEMHTSIIYNRVG